MGTAKLAYARASVAFPSVDRRNQSPSVLLTSALPSRAARLAATNRLPLNVRCRQKADAEIEHGGVSACGKCCCWVFQVYHNERGTPAEMTASKGSSHHVFLFPRVQVNLHVEEHFDVVHLTPHLLTRHESHFAR